VEDISPNKGISSKEITTINTKEEDHPNNLIQETKLHKVLINKEINTSQDINKEIIKEGTKERNPHMKTGTKEHHMKTEIKGHLKEWIDLNRVVV